MSAKSPSLDMFVAAIQEFRKAVADPSYNITTARERLASTKGVNVDSQLVEKIRDLIIDIDNELYTTSCSFSEAKTEFVKKILIWETMGLVVFKAFGKSESNESMPAIKEHTASILRDKESEMDVGGSTTSQRKGQGKNIKPAWNDIAGGKGMSKEHDTVVEGVTIDKGEENQMESAFNNVVNDKSISKVHDTVVEGTTIDKGEEKQIESALSNVLSEKSISKVQDTVLEDATIDIGKEKQIKPALNDKVNGKGTSKVHDMLHDILVEGAATEEKQIKLVLKEMVNNKGTSKVHNIFIERATIDKGKEKQSEPVVEGPKKKKKKRKGKSKKDKMPTDNGKNDKGKSKENDDFVEASTLDKGKGKESELLIKGSATDEGKKKNNDDEADVSQESLDLIREAKDIVLEPISSDEDDEASRLIVEPDSTGQNAHRHEPMKVEARQDTLMAFRKIHRLLKHAIRPQTAASRDLDLFCRFVEDPVFFEMMSETTEELRWNRAVVEHPHNRMITTILRRTAHLRPTDGIHHPSGLSVAPLLAPQQPPLPPGPVPATAAVTTPTKKQDQKDDPNILELINASVKEKALIEETLKELDRREAIFVAELKTGPPLPFVDDIFRAFANARRHLKEKARLEDAGGKRAEEGG